MSLISDSISPESRPGEALRGGATASRRVVPPSDAHPLEALIESDPAYSSEPVELEDGAEFSDFEIRGKLGSGGMATVYRA